MKRLSLLIIPQSGNNYRAGLLRPSFLALFIAIYLLNQSLLKSLTILKPGILGYSSEITVEKVLLQVNHQRQINNLPPLQFNSSLAQSATKKAQDMFVKNYWAHTSPSEASPWQFIKDSGYQYTVAGENLAKDFYDTSSMIKAWMKSPSHRDNIIHQKYEEIGIAVIDGVLGGIKTTVVVQHFGKPTVTTAAIPATAEEQRLNNLSSVPSSSQVLSLTQTNPSPTINPRLVNKTLGTIMFVIIIATLAIDGYITLKKNTKRLAGSTTGHIGFLAIIFLLMLFTQQGTVF